MATYKIVLTVKDRFGRTKEINGGSLDVNLDNLTEEDINNIEEALPLENYVTKPELDAELNEIDERLDETYIWERMQ